VIVFGGSEGGLSTGEALGAYLASLGYPALGLAYFDAPGLPQELSNVPLEYFERAYEWLVAQPEVDGRHLAVMGGSRGGELALLLGATFPWVTAVVAEAPSGVLWPNTDWSTPTFNTSSWTYQGTALPFIAEDTSFAPPSVTLWDGSKAAAIGPVLRASLSAATTEQIDAATTRIEKTQGPILMIAGADDQLDPGCDLAKTAMERLEQLGHAAAHPDQLHCYAGAGHNASWGPPGRPTRSQLSIPLGPGFVAAIGGDPVDIAHAQRDADTKLRAFLAANLP
jgi:dienelactone hydrolase